MKFWLGIFVLIVGLGFAAWAFIGGSALSGGLTQQVTLSDLQNYVNSGSERERSWSQRVTLTIDTDDGPMSASSIMRVTWTENNPRINDASWTPRVSGEMPFIKIKDEFYVVAIFGNNESEEIAQRFLVRDSLVTGLNGRPSEEFLSKPLENATFVRGDDLFPTLVAFTNPEDPTSIQLFDENNATLKVEIVPDNLSAGNSQQSLLLIFPWISSLSNSRFMNSPTAIKLENGRYVVPTKRSFIRD
jgi:hypothetical protein